VTVTQATLSKHIHTAIFWPFSQDHLGEPVPEEIFFWTFMVQGKITEADTPTIWLGATPSGLISDPPPSFPFLCRMPFLPQPSHFILAWDRQQICWLAYPVAWFNSIKALTQISHYQDLQCQYLGQ